MRTFACCSSQSRLNVSRTVSLPQPGDRPSVNLGLRRGDLTEHLRAVGILECLVGPGGVTLPELKAPSPLSQVATKGKFLGVVADAYGYSLTCRTHPPSCVLLKQRERVLCGQGSRRHISLSGLPPRSWPKADGLVSIQWEGEG